MDDAHVLLVKDASKATITVSNPDKLNALTHHLMGELRGVFENVANGDDVRVVLFTGASAPLWLV